MTTNPGDPKPSAWQSLTKCVKGLVQAMMPTNEPDTEEILPSWDRQPPTATPVAEPVGAATVPMAVPVAAAGASAPATLTCRICKEVNPVSRAECRECGYHFTDADRSNGPVSAPAGAGSAPPGAAAVPAGPVVVLQNRFELGEKVTERLGVIRYRGLDRGDGSRPPAPVFILQEKIAVSVPAAEAAPAQPEDPDEILPTFDDFPSGPNTDILPARPMWPSLTWESGLLLVEHPGLPRQVASFSEAGFEYLVEEIPTGQSLWDAWDDPDRSAYQKYTYLMQVAETLHSMHQYHAILEGLNPGIVIVTPEGQARITDLTDLLPLPLPEEPRCAAPATPPRSCWPATATSMPGPTCTASERWFTRCSSAGS